MRRYDYVDAFIAETGDDLGRTFTIEDFRRWVDSRLYDKIDVQACLTAHRRSPQRRVFTTERVGMGPHAYYRVVRKPTGVQAASVLRMHQQQSQEMVDRWVAEYEARMEPVTRKSKKAKRLFAQAHAEVNAIATVLHVRLSGLDDDED